MAYRGEGATCTYQKWAFIGIRGRCGDMLLAKCVRGLGLKARTGYRSDIGHDPCGGVQRLHL